ncbi:MFS domain-containing protein [Fusarium keratoplasticum]|uniref:MFS domain-containing protein n=1 Tax=Fusarium keratoplasticum TaxID=1328300 RepID=A0ACC0QC02_9HYPO|nr:MFS domain-containing protein [Fusarium keratoplasticum]KAI8648239.1 MFS domain-containing protein [Fusarium keratoplasticum]
MGPATRNHSSANKPDERRATSEETLLLQQDTPSQYVTLPAPPVSDRDISWASIPKKGQLAVILFARLAEPISERSLTSYLFYQLRWFDPSLDPSEIARQAGYLTAAFAAAQCLTSMWWGRAADDPRIGRERVLLIGLSGTAISALGMGFAKSLHTAFFFRHQTRAFLLLPMCFNVGVIIGPLLSGFLADPIHALSSLFGPGSFFGGVDGVRWMRSFPYALPNLFFAIILGAAALGIILGLDETHPQLRHRRDLGRALGKSIMATIMRRKNAGYENEAIQDDYLPTQTSHLLEDEIGGVPELEPEPKQKSSLRAILSRKVCLNMAQRFLQSLHVSSFNSMFFSLLPAPQADGRNFHLPFRFGGGLGLSSKKMGFANTIIGMIGIPLQLFIYPRLIGRLGVKNSYRYFLPLGIVAYVLVPYLVLLPASNSALVWTCLSAVLSMQVLSRTFVNPATVMLVNDCAPTPDTLGTVHGMAQSTSSAAGSLDRRWVAQFSAGD